jgi:hypothetical protein
MEAYLKLLPEEKEVIDTFAFAIPRPKSEVVFSTVLAHMTNNGYMFYC